MKKEVKKLKTYGEIWLTIKQTIERAKKSEKVNSNVKKIEKKKQEV